MMRNSTSPLGTFQPFNYPPRPALVGQQPILAANTSRKVLKTEQPDGASQQFYPTRAVDDGDIGKRGRSRFTSGNANSDEPDANDA
jgi:hypothetical protein